MPCAAGNCVHYSNARVIINRPGGDAAFVLNCSDRVLPVVASEVCVSDYGNGWAGGNGDRF